MAYRIRHLVDGVGVGGGAGGAVGGGDSVGAAGVHDVAVVEGEGFGVAPVNLACGTKRQFVSNGKKNFTVWTLDPLPMEFIAKRGDKVQVLCRKLRAANLDGPRLSCCATAKCL